MLFFPRILVRPLPGPSGLFQLVVVLSLALGSCKESALRRLSIGHLRQCFLNVFQRGGNANGLVKLIVGIILASYPSVFPPLKLLQGSIKYFIIRSLGALATLMRIGRGPSRGTACNEIRMVLFATRIGHPPSSV